MAGILNITATKLLTYYLTSPGLNISIRVSGWNAIQNGSWSIILIHWSELQGDEVLHRTSPDSRRFIFIREFLISYHQSCWLFDSISALYIYTIKSLKTLPFISPSLSCLSLHCTGQMISSWRWLAVAGVA